jgi:hypothetical protein
MVGPALGLALKGTQDLVGLDALLAEASLVECEGGHLK